MRISRGAKKRAIKQQLYNMAKAEGRGYYFGDAKHQRSLLVGQCNAINTNASAAVGQPIVKIDPAVAVHSMMKRVATFYGLRNKYRGAAYLGPVRSALQ